jgi:hypothetical protein
MSETQQDFIGDAQLTAILREKVANYDPARLAPCLNSVESQIAVNKLNKYRGDFVYVHVRTAVNFSSEEDNRFTFMVRSDDGGYYLFVVNSSLLSDNWNDNVPSAWW